MWDRDFEEKDKGNSNTNQQKGSSKLKIPDKTFNNPLASKELFSNEDRRLLEGKSEFIIKPIPVEMSQDNIEPVPIPQMKIPNSKETPPPNSSLFLKETIEKNSQSNRAPIVISKASIESPFDYIRSNIVQNSEPSEEALSPLDIYSIQKENILFNTKRTIESLISTSIIQIKALSDLQDECMGAVRDTPNLNNEIIEKLNRYKHSVRSLFNKGLKKNDSKLQPMQNKAQEQYIIPSSKKIEKESAIEESKKDSKPSIIAAPCRDLAIKLNKCSISLYDPLINKKINKVKWKKQLTGSAILFTKNNSILHVGGNENRHEEIDIATGEEKKYLL